MVQVWIGGVKYQLMIRNAAIAAGTADQSPPIAAITITRGQVDQQDTRQSDIRSDVDEDGGERSERKSPGKKPGQASRRRQRRDPGRA